MLFIQKMIKEKTLGKKCPLLIGQGETPTTSRLDLIKGIHLLNLKPTVRNDFNSEQQTVWIQ